MSILSGFVVYLLDV